MHTAYLRNGTTLRAWLHSKQQEAQQYSAGRRWLTQAWPWHCSSIRDKNMLFAIGWGVSTTVIIINIKYTKSPQQT